MQLSEREEVKDVLTISSHHVARSLVGGMDELVVLKGSSGSIMFFKMQLQERVLVSSISLHGFWIVQVN